MRTPAEALAVLRAVAAELDPHATRIAIYAHLRGGLPSSSMSDGRGSAETHQPALEEHDAQLLATLDTYTTRLDALATLALALRSQQRDVLYRQTRPAPKSKEYVRSELKAAADEYDRTHNLEPGTTWAKQQHEAPPTKIDWCLSCARVTINGYPHNSPVADEKRGGKDCTLCRWCLEIYRETGAWPPITMVRARAEGRRITVKVKPG